MKWSAKWSVKWGVKWGVRRSRTALLLIVIVVVEKEGIEGGVHDLMLHFKL